ncbi:hypothetical protein RD792_007995 [Penstemon davidsonii]|uniref:Fungal lipase-like domain-containing protein n=1 Tax=Penstemon davidsonii TaxID=160366 RepID=A0ABR0D7W3_9LAMI|nr:hypothetical protein RD792_007995 [Penstemon davidsonii]
MIYHTLAPFTSSTCHVLTLTTQTKGLHYLIAFRGTINKPDNRAQDLKLDLHCIINNLQDSRRFKIGIESAQNVIARAGPGNVLLAGHSLGSSIVLLIGRHRAKNTAAAKRSGGDPKAQEIDPFIVLSSWIPYLFINPNDPICSEYVGYFEHMEKIGDGENWEIGYKAFDW